jgi:hypothetical protein
MAMQENAAVFLKVRARDRLTPRTIGIKGRGPQDNVLAVERAVALTNRHGGLPRVVPHGSEAIRFGIKAGDSGPGALRSVSVEEGEIRLQKLAVLDHVLLTRAFRHDRLSVQGEERFDDVPVARKLCEQFLTGTRRVRRLVLIVGLLRYRRSGNEQGRDNAFLHVLHGTQTICEESLVLRVFTGRLPIQGREPNLVRLRGPRVNILGSNPRNLRHASPRAQLLHLQSSDLKLNPPTHPERILGCT